MFWPVEHTALAPSGVLYGPSFGMPRRFCDAVGEVIDRVEPSHALLHQKEYGMAVALGEHGH
jgi:hypothetical protein